MTRAPIVKIISPIPSCWRLGNVVFEGVELFMIMAVVVAVGTIVGVMLVLSGV